MRKELEFEKLENEKGNKALEEHRQEIITLFKRVHDINQSALQTEGIVILCRW